MKKKLIISGVVLVLLLLGAEGILRLWGFGNPPLYISSDQYEYIYAPNQDLCRYGNRIWTNAYSMRSAPIQKGDRVKLMLFGDSIIHGGSRTDHDSLASTRLEKAFQELGGMNDRVLNVSCGSWGPGNNYAWLQENGDFGAEQFVLVFSSHDYDDWMTFVPIVGNSRLYPDKKPPFALYELFDRIIYPKITGSYRRNPEAKPLIPAAERQGMVQGWQDFLTYSREHQIPLLVVLHPEKAEVEAGVWNEKGTKLIAWLEENQVEYLDELQAGTQLQFYRDYIHYNDQGQAFLFHLLEKRFLES